MERLILFLVRIKLGLKKGEAFRFTNQKNKKDEYYFGYYCIWKVREINGVTYITQSNVSLNWLLNPCCEIEKAQHNHNKTHNKNRFLTKTDF